MPSAVQKIGYLIPEFPGQTHIFFWRELQALPGKGVTPELVSTRPPPARIISHSWAREAMSRTEYLAPPGPLGVAKAAAEVARAMPTGWARCLASIARAEGLDAKGRAQLLAFAVMGGRLASLARERGWTHVHVHSCANAAHVALFANLLSGLPYSLTLHGPLDDYGPNQREKWRHAKFAFVITKKLLKEVHEELAGALPSRIELAPMGVELRKFNRAVPYAAWTGEGPLRVFSCGRLNPCKGHADLIDAVGMLRAKGLDARLSIAGEDEAGGTTYRKVLEAKVQESGLGDAVTLLGAVSEDVVRGEIERAHIFSLASLQEPLGVAIMEAMAMRVPVVVTGAGGVPELVDDGVDGILVPPQQPGILADRLEAVARDAQEAHRLGEAGRRKVETTFSSERSADMLAKLLQRAVV
ncbi:exopolysaccharide biosynthesis GT4 family glycosyltransferase EpsE [Corallococcus macrosporus]|uniref:Colanic acid biosynthesis glycosyltransferase WcaL n=1 Tax=Corallococcus macrosporus DSM 14697 TaxID=1189310 RepID=A0A286SGG5_9BACT|nr:exopolysaccharide biosynthesis GT4 family glycosyltransferase EpsE [Corallococcus macrosporus]ATB51502.1 colanic acid biosynthesis glycosyltransferase WcaL [Corallococcus macrosporus DSM 14697]